MDDQSSGFAAVVRRAPGTRFNRNRLDCRSLQTPTGESTMALLVDEDEDDGQDAVSLCSMVSGCSEMDWCAGNGSSSLSVNVDGGCHRVNRRHSHVSNALNAGRNRLMSLARKSLKVPLAHFRRLSEPAVMNSMVGNENLQLVQRCVIVTRDENGFGLTVSGDNPVFVQAVEEDGAAAHAGVRQGDRIIKVNGTQVTGANHMDVVKMITRSAGNYVALTLLGRPPIGYTGAQQRPVSLNQNMVIGDRYGNHLSQSQTLPALNRPPPNTTVSPASFSSTGSGSSPSTSGSSSNGICNNVRRSATTVGTTSKEFITGPQPIDEEKQAEWKHKRIQIIHRMLEEERRNVEELNVELRARPNNTDMQNKIQQAQKRIRNLENQLSDFNTANASSGTTPSSQPNAPSQGDGASCADKSSQPGVKGQSTVGEPSVESTDRGPPIDRKSHLDNNRSLDSQLHFVSPAQIDVVPMDESDSDTETAAPLDTEGPFSNFAELKGRPAALAVFLHYLISNSDPASLLFFLITDIYSNGNGKELRKWAYEIHSSFLVPTAPLRVATIDNDTWQEIETVLSTATVSEHEETMKRVFLKARQKALDEINEHLIDFRRKRTLGLGNVFGESLLNGLTPGDTVREKKVIDALLMQHFDTFFSGGISDYDALPERTQVLATALATVLRHMNVKPTSSTHEKLFDKCPSYVMKEKSRFTRPLLAKPSKKALQVKGHHFLPSPVYSTAQCYQCSGMIWGINPTAYFCSNCDVIVHKQCANALEDTCYNSSHNKRTPGGHHGGGGHVLRKAPKSSTPRSTVELIESMTTTATTTASPIAVGHQTPSASIPVKEQYRRRLAIAEEPEEIVTSQLTADDLDELCDQTTDLPCSPPNCSSVSWPSKTAWTSADSGYGGDCAGSAAAVQASSFIIRSQSMRSRDEQLRMSRKGINDQNGRRAKSDVDADDKSIVIAQVVSDQQQPPEMSVSSSSSSMSRNSLPESPTASQETFRQLNQRQTQQQQQTTMNTSTTANAVTDTGSQVILTGSGSDSDLEAETECPSLEQVLDWETIRHLKPKERKRQEVINELFHTERTHVRNLKVLHRLFYERLLAFQILPPDFIKLLFANIEEILDLHKKINSGMKSKIKKGQLVGDIGDLLLNFLSGEAGEQFGRAVAAFYQHQQYALEALKLRQKKDQKLAQFLQDAESNPVCRKLQLKDMLPMEMQRLTKYPLLIENVAKYTAEPSAESEKLRRTIDCAKTILEMVNEAKRNAEDLRKLEDLQRRLDTAPFTKVQHEMVKDFRTFDLRQYKLILEGPLSWKLGKNKAVDLHVVLTDELLVLLTRNSDGQRLSLRFHNSTFVSSSSKEDSKFTHCPLLKLGSLILKDVATDKKAFFLVSTSAGPQIYELVAQSTAEKKNWFKLIKEQIEVCKRTEAALAGHAQSNLAANALLPAAAVSAAKSQQSDASGSLESEKSTSENPELGVASESIVKKQDEEAPLERVQIISQPRLINPSEVQVCQPTVLEHAEAVLTPLERLKRKDESIMRALVDKQKILSKLFSVPVEDLEKATEAVMDNKTGNKEARELALAAIVQTNRLLEAINASMKLSQEEEKQNLLAASATSSTTSTTSTTTTTTTTITATTETEAAGALRLVAAEKPAVSCGKLTLIAAPLMKHLTSLLHSLQLMEEDLKRVRQELHQHKERTGELPEQQEKTTSTGGGGGGGGDQQQKQQKTGRPSGRSPQRTEPTTNIDEYMAGQRGVSGKTSGGGRTPQKSGGKSESSADELAPRRSISRAPSDDVQGRLSAGPGTSPSVSPLSNCNSPEASSSARTSAERSPGNSPARDSRSSSRPAAGKPPPSNLATSDSQSGLDSASGTPVKKQASQDVGLASLKSPDSSDGDDEKRREKRRQKRQRHTALSGLESRPNAAELGTANRQTKETQGS